jgi:hypothetical protein
MNRVRAKTGFICAHGDVRRHTVPPERHKSGVSRISTRPFRRPSPSKERPECPRKIIESKVMQHMNRIRAKNGFICTHGDVRRQTVPQERHKSGVSIISTRPFCRPLLSKERPEDPRKMTESKVIQHINMVRAKMDSFARTGTLGDIPRRHNGTNRVFP